MTLDRRLLLKSAVAAGAATAVAAAPAAARERRTPPADALGMLYDATLCIGCKACVVACREANGLAPDTSNSPGGLHDAPIDLNETTKNVIMLYREGDRTSYMKRQCMHCVDPACVGACMLGALGKREHGAVTWEGDSCIGCRYCAVVCPFEVPKFEWSKANPRIVKCELCAARPGKAFASACAEVCPRQAVISGPYAELLGEAKRRLAEQPERYEPRVYGDGDAGGTQALYLSAAGIPFAKLGLPELGHEPVPEVQQTVQHGIYRGFIAPAVLYAALGVVMWRNKRHGGAGKEA